MIIRCNQKIVRKSLGHIAVPQWKMGTKANLRNVVRVEIQYVRCFAAQTFHAADW